MARGTRPRKNRIYVHVTPEELKEIDRSARACGMSHSCYLRELGRNYQPKSMYNREAVQEMTIINAEHNRLGNVLKQWLFEPSRENSSIQDIRGVLKQIEGLQQELARIVMERVDHNRQASHTRRRSLGPPSRTR